MINDDREHLHVETTLTKRYDVNVILNATLLCFSHASHVVPNLNMYIGFNDMIDSLRCSKLASAYIHSG